MRHLAQKQVELSNGIDTEHVKVSSEHLDHHNPHTFEMEDLKKLIAKVSSDLNEADEKRRKEFKEYEMQKEYEKQQKLQHLSGSEREAFEKQIKENETKHKQHEPVSEKNQQKKVSILLLLCLFYSWMLCKNVTRNHNISLYDKSMPVMF